MPDADRPLPTDPIPRPRGDASRRPVLPRYPRWAAWLVPVVAFAVLAPALPWYDIGNGIEQLHAATVLEMRRGGPWVVPTLNGKPRLAKPPMPAWVGAACVTDATMAAIDAPDAAARSAGYARLAWEIRWPALLAGCLMLLATADLGTTIGGRRVGLAAGVVAGSSILFLNYVRVASTDVHLALWVATGNALLARAALRGQVWIGVVGGGAALGLAFMSKGPVGLIQTVLPFGLWWLLVRGKGTSLVNVRTKGSDVPLRPDVSRASRPCERVGSQETLDSTGSDPPSPAHGRDARDTSGRGREVTHPNRPPLFAVALLGTAAFLLIALPWPLVVLRTLPGAWGLWRAEITREGATDHAYAPVWSYLSLLPNLLPWLPAFVVGACLPFRRVSGDLHVLSAAWPDGFPGRVRLALTAAAACRRFRAHRGYALAGLLLVVPVVVMSLARDKHDRYLLPVLPAAAVLSARGLLAILAGARRSVAGAKVAFNLQIGVVAVIVVGLPVVGTTGRWLRAADGSAWYGPALGGGALVVAAALAAAMFAAAGRRRPDVSVAVAGVAMLGVAALLLWGYGKSPDGRAEMRPIAERIRALRPGATVGYYDFRRATKPLPPDLPIYLNRPVEAYKRGSPATQPVAAPGGPDVLVVLQREQEPEPVLPGWRPLAKEPYRQRFWHAVERDR